MNRFEAVVTHIENEESLHSVSFAWNGAILRMVALELPDLLVGSKVLLGVKSTHVALAKHLAGLLSFSNQLSASIETIKEGKILSVITLKSHDALLQSIITSNSVKNMPLIVGDEVTLLIKSSDLYIERIL